jgi:IS30 family transposase
VAALEIIAQAGKSLSGSAHISSSGKKLAAMIKSLQPKVSNRQIAKALGAHPSTIDRDAAKAAGRGKNVSKNNSGGAAKAAPTH